MLIFFNGEAGSMNHRIFEKFSSIFTILIYNHFFAPEITIQNDESLSHIESAENVLSQLK